MRILSTHVVTLGIALEKTQNVSSKCVQGSGQWWASFNADWYYFIGNTLKEHAINISSHKNNCLKNEHITKGEEL